MIADILVTVPVTGSATRGHQQSCMTGPTSRVPSPSASSSTALLDQAPVDHLVAEVRLRHDQLFSVAIESSVVVIFFALQWQNINVNWWGNTVSCADVDGGGHLDASGNSMACALLEVPPNDFPNGLQ